MIKLTESLKEWHGPLFVDAFQNEISQLSVEQLRLQQTLRYGNCATTENMKLIILSKNDDGKNIFVKVGIFYNSVISGCQCADVPTLDSAEIEYTELLFTLDKKTAETRIEVVS